MINALIYLLFADTRAAGTFGSWEYGQNNAGNLLGTIRSLDDAAIVPLNCTINANVTVHNEELHCEWGLVSREGWAVVDDSSNYVLDADYWWSGVNTDQIDLYLYGCGAHMYT